MICSILHKPKGVGGQGLNMLRRSKTRNTIPKGICFYSYKLCAWSFLFFWMGKKVSEHI